MSESFKVVIKLYLLNNLATLSFKASSYRCGFSKEPIPLSTTIWYPIDGSSDSYNGNISY